VAGSDIEIRILIDVAALPILAIEPVFIVPHQRRGSAHRGQRGEAAGAIEQKSLGCRLRLPLPAPAEQI
jgi:hypothetical protein